MHRLFVGLRPPPPIRARLLAAMGGVHGARWQDEGQLHVTARFIGSVDRPMAEDIAAALGTISHPPIEAALAGVGQFDKRGRTHSLWAGLRPHEPFAALHRKLDSALVRLGLEPERRAYIPHVTLARLNAPTASVDRYLADHAGLASESFTLGHFMLYESHLGHEAASYEVVARYPLD